jgi:hypothetical protein
MRIVEAFGFILFGRPVRRPRRGTPRLGADLIAFDQMTDPARKPASERLEEAVGTELLRELERRLDLEGQLVPGRRRSRHARRAA